MFGSRREVSLSPMVSTRPTEALVGPASCAAVRLRRPRRSARLVVLARS
jgi:hypothetical protein